MPALRCAPAPCPYSSPSVNRNTLPSLIANPHTRLAPRYHPPTPITTDAFLLLAVPWRSMWVNLILGLICYLGFILFRGMKGFEFYHARLVSAARGRTTAMHCSAAQRPGGESKQQQQQQQQHSASAGGGGTGEATRLLATVSACSAIRAGLQFAACPPPLDRHCIPAQLTHPPCPAPPALPCSCCPRCRASRRSSACTATSACGAGCCRCSRCRMRSWCGVRGWTPSLR